MTDAFEHVEKIREKFAAAGYSVEAVEWSALPVDRAPVISTFVFCATPRGLMRLELHAGTNVRVAKCKDNISATRIKSPDD